VSGINARDALQSAWYSNLLVGLSTQGAVTAGTTANLAVRLLASVFSNHPADSMAMLSGLIKGFSKGYAEAKHVLAGGVVSMGEHKPSAQNGLELMIKQGGPKTPAQALAYVSSLGGLTRYALRSLSAIHGTFFHSLAAEGRAHLAASRAARETGARPSSPEFARAMMENLGESTTTWDSAVSQARSELTAAAGKGEVVKNNNVKRRAYEIIDQQRPSWLKQEAGRYGDLASFGFTPEGSGGWVYNMLRQVQHLTAGNLSVLRPEVPFTRFPAAMMSAFLDMTPIGILRGLKGEHLLKSSPGAINKPFAPWEARERMMAGTLATLGLTAMGAAAWKHKDANDVDAPFMVYGMGPPDKAKRAQMPQGWKPFTVKVGNKYISYSESPLIYGLAALGGMMDRARYGRASLDDDGGVARAFYLAKLTGQAVLSHGVLSSLADLVSVAKGESSPSKLPAKLTSGFIPAQGMLKDIATLMDPTKLDDSTVVAAIFRDVPVVRSMLGRPALNVFGEPVTYEGLQRLPVIKRIITNQGSDPQADFLARNKLWIPALPERMDLGQYLPPKAHHYWQNQAAQLGRLHAGALTDEEIHTFAQRCGQLTREAVQRVQAQAPATPLTKEQLQKEVTRGTDVARRIAMRELLDKMR
jgi:hypothetical protein